MMTLERQRERLIVKYADRRAKHRPSKFTYLELRDLTNRCLRLCVRRRKRAGA